MVSFHVHKQKEIIMLFQPMVNQERALELLKVLRKKRKKRRNPIKRFLRFNKQHNVLL